WKRISRSRRSTRKPAVTKISRASAKSIGTQFIRPNGPLPPRNGIPETGQKPGCRKGTGPFQSGAGRNQTSVAQKTTGRERRSFSHPDCETSEVELRRELPVSWRVSLAVHLAEVRIVDAGCGATEEHTVERIE